MTLRIIGGKYKGRILKAPKVNSTRPTQGMLREAVFNICQNQIENARFLDLFAGSGAMGFEALSRGAMQATFVEQNRQAISCIKENIEALEIKDLAEIIPLKADRALEILAKKSALFDIVYLDPPYDIQATQVHGLLDDLIPLLAIDALVFLEERHSPKNPSNPYIPTGLSLKDSRRFGIALLHQYRFFGNKNS